MPENVDAYRTQSRWSDPGRWASLLSEIRPEPAEIVRAVSGLLLHPFIAPMRGVEMPAAAGDDRELRSAEAILDRVHARDQRPFTAARSPEHRCFCVCAGFARLATAVFRAHREPARCRAGFAGYFNPGFLEDHWVCEYRDGGEWRLLDAQLDDAAVRELGLGFSPRDVPRDQFLDGSTAWHRMRTGELDPARMGLSVLGLTGAWFAAGNVMLDVAALNKEELLPWEKWSVGRELGPGHDPDSEWAARFDEVAALLGGSPDAALAQRVYREHPWLRVTPSVLSFANGPPVEIRIGS
jgi:hypothetical protein